MVMMSTGGLSSAHYVYVSGPLQAAEDLPTARRLYERVAEICERAGWGAYLPHSATDPEIQGSVPSETVFRKDMSKLRRAAVVIAFVGSPSSGVGAEVAIATEAGIPVIAMWNSDEQPSRFLQGLLRVRDDCRCVSYGGVDDLEPLIRSALASVRPRSTAKYR